VKFWRHLVVVACLVAAVVVLGVVWEHSSAANWITPPGPPAGGKILNGPPPGSAVKLGPGGRLPRGFHVPAGGHLVRGVGGGDSGMWFNLSEAGNLTSTVEIVAAVMAGVIAADIARRRWRKARRAAAISASSPET
jgi:hypothetical protein